jgi:hypothetical protein
MPSIRPIAWLTPLPAMALVAVSAYFLGWLPALGAALTYAVQPRTASLDEPPAPRPRRHADPDGNDQQRGRRPSE